MIVAKEEGMRVFRGFDNLPAFNSAVATVGSFDGVHRGHLQLLVAATAAARESGGESVVLTFDVHPRVVLGRAEGLRLLTSIEEKIEILESCGVDNLIIIPFDRDFSRLSQGEFVEQYLVERVAISHLVVGYNHRLGRDTGATSDDLYMLSERCGFSIIEVEEWRDAECGNVSSTVVRRLISMGDIERANQLLSRHYVILGRVDDGGRVWVDDALKLRPAAGGYLSIVNGCEARVSIDENGVVGLCGDDFRDVEVKIELLKKES